MAQKRGGRYTTAYVTCFCTAGILWCCTYFKNVLYFFKAYKCNLHFKKGEIMTLITDYCHEGARANRGRTIHCHNLEGLMFTFEAN